MRRFLGCIVASRPGPRSRPCVHSVHEIAPALLGDGLVPSRYASSSFLKGVEENDQRLRAPVQNPNQLASVVAPQFSQSRRHAGRVRKREWRIIRVECIQPIDLQIDRRAGARRQPIKELPHRLLTIGIAVVDSLESHRRPGYPSTSPRTASARTNSATRSASAPVRSAGSRSSAMSPRRTLKMNGVRPVDEDGAAGASAPTPGEVPLPVPRRVEGPVRDEAWFVR